MGRSPYTDAPSLPSRHQRGKAQPLRGKPFGATRVQHGKAGVALNHCR
jgi:hypothetical protein